MRRRVQTGPENRQTHRSSLHVLNDTQHPKGYVDLQHGWQNKPSYPAERHIVSV